MPDEIPAIVALADGESTVEDLENFSALALQVDTHDLDLDQVAGLDHLMRILDEAIRQRRDVHQPVLMHAHVDKGAEVGDIGNGALQHHAGLQVLKDLDALQKLRRLELGTRVAPGLFQLGQDVLYRG